MFTLKQLIERKTIKKLATPKSPERERKKNLENSISIKQAKLSRRANKENLNNPKLPLISKLNLKKMDNSKLISQTEALPSKQQARF